MRKTLCLLIAPLLLALPAAAWNGVGHRTVAELAWREMDAAERRSASDLLRQHPHYQQVLVAEVPAGVDTNEWAFLTAAVWLDLARPAKPGEPAKPRLITQYDIYPHAIGYPFIRKDDRKRVSLDQFVIAKPNAEMVLSSALSTLRRRKASAHDRAVSLGVVLHLYGDLHQPLHTANLVTKAKPKGHGLGSSFLVLDQNRNQTSLHTFWDALPGSDLSYASVMALADELAAAPQLQRARLREYSQHRTIHSWVQESHRAAVDFACAEDRVRFADAAAVKSGKIAVSDIPALTPEYVREAQIIMRRRLALAGWRLARTLKSVW
ncbi:MAG TPA: S1/P1 nuclease [Verrucomicrobiota bacterium]|nr:S1/P1 nuclease [Verrucomicrobiota bacterium]HQL78077.1 S1/P1 nuclease [Verrucomicrobiota bacterium]